MKLIFAIFLLGAFLNAQDIAPQACDDQQQSGNTLKGSFLKKGELEGEFCDSSSHASSGDLTQESKTIKDLKAFLDSPQKQH